MIIIVTDHDGDEVKYWSMPDDELDSEKFIIPEISEITQDGQEYIAVLWANPKGADIKPYEVNEHIVYAGCGFADKIKKGNKLVCKEKELYIVLHPKLEWENYHIRNIKA